MGKGDEDGLERGRECLAKWGFRRAEDIVWVKMNRGGGRKRDVGGMEMPAEVGGQGEGEGEERMSMEKETRTDEDGVGEEVGAGKEGMNGMRGTTNLDWSRDTRGTSGSAGGGLFASSKEHCLMGIRGTVRRSTDSRFVHCNVDTDVMVWEDDMGECGVLHSPMPFVCPTLPCLVSSRLA